MINYIYRSFLPINPIQQHLGAWAYLLLALVVAAEGPIATLAGAAAAAAGLLNPILVFVSASIGNLTADILWYSVGYVRKPEWLVKYAGWLGIKENIIVRLQEDIHEHIRKILFVAKLTLGFVIPALIAAGLARVPFKRWFGVLFAAECIWTGSLVLTGYYFGTLVQRIETNLRWISIGGALIFVAIVLVYFSRFRQKMEKEL
jgi:membrane protein DedA with SNARE-associated domain